MICIPWRFRNNRFWHNLSFVFMTWSFSLLRKNVSISKLLNFSLNFFNLLQFTSCSKLLSPIFSFFLTSHSCLTFNFVEKNLPNGSHPACQPTSSTVPPLTLCEPYKSLKTILGLAKPTSNQFLQFSLDFFNLLQFASCSFFLSSIFSNLLLALFSFSNFLLFYGLSTFFYFL